MELELDASNFVEKLLLYEDESGRPIDSLLCEAAAAKARSSSGAALGKLLDLRNTDEQLLLALKLDASLAGKAAVRYRIECRLSALVTSSGNLGPLIRLAVIVQELSKTNSANDLAWRVNEVLREAGYPTQNVEHHLLRYFKQQDDEASAPAKRSRPKLDMPEDLDDETDATEEPTVAGRRTSHAPGGQRIAEPTIVKHALATLVNRLPSRARLPKVSWESLMSMPVSPATDMVDAIEAYRRWLHSGLCFTDDRSTVVPYINMSMYGVLATNPSVKRASSAIGSASVLALGRRLPVIQLQSVDRQSLCRAAVLQATVGSDGCPPSVQALRAVHLYASKMGDDEFAFTVKGFINPLAQAFGIDLGDQSQPLNASEYGQVMGLVRQGLTLHPLLVVVHGLNVGIGRIAPMLDLINGSSVAIDIIRSLCLSHLVDPLSERQPPLDRSALWVVCTNHEVAELHPFTHQAVKLSEDGWQPGDWWKTVFARTRPAQNVLPVETGDIPQLTSGPRSAWNENLHVPPSDHELIVAATIQKWEDAGGKTFSVDWKYSGEQRIAQVDKLMAVLVHSLTLHDMAGLWLLLAISSTTDGVCLATLRRLLESNRRLTRTNAISRVSGNSGLSSKERSLSAASIGADYKKCQDALNASRNAGDDFGASTLSAFMPLLTVYKEQISEHLSPRAMRWEVGELGEATSIDGEPVDEGVHPGAFRYGVRFVSPRLRDAFIEAVQGLDDAGNHLSLDFSECVKLAQYSVAVESFSQAGALLARSSMAEIVSLQRRRLLIQALYHLCCVGELRRTLLMEPDREFQALHSFPRDDKRRRMLAYMVVYQQLVEDRGAWTISRRYGRSELRASLLLALSYWGTSELLVPEAPRSANSLLTARFGTEPSSLDLSILREIGKAPQPGDRYLAQLMRNLCHACTDADDLKLATAVLDLLNKAKAARPSDVLPVTTTQHEELELRIQIVNNSPHDHLPKLEFTRLDDSGRREDAATLCRSQLEQRMEGICARWLEIGENAARTLGLRGQAASSDPTESTSFKRINGELLEESGRVVLAVGKSASRLTSIADWAVRWAAVKAEEFDDLPSRLRASPDVARDKSGRAASLVSAWVIFWLADELRARIGEQPGVSGERWGRLASRYYRYGIRLSLRLARILAELGKTSKLLAGTSRYLLEFASTRTSILARDYNALLRELFQVLLLRASIARTKERIDVLLAKTHGPSGDHLTQQTIHAPYLDAFSYLHAAERRWLALGGAGALTRRLVFERINLGQTALWRIDEQVGQARQEKDEVVMLQTKALLACLDADLRVLSRFSESDDQQNVGFWKSLYNWHDHRQTELKEKLGWLSAELDS